MKSLRLHQDPHRGQRLAPDHPGNPQTHGYCVTERRLNPFESVGEEEVHRIGRGSHAAVYSAGGLSAEACEGVTNTPRWTARTIPTLEQHRDFQKRRPAHNGQFTRTTRRAGDKGDPRRHRSLCESRNVLDDAGRARDSLRSG